LGEDGTTHQPVEQLASLRAMHGLHIVRPADANEAAYAWRDAIQHKTGPTMLVLTRQKLSVFDRNKYGKADALYKGAYILSKEKNATPDVILIATGSEVELILKAQDDLQKQNIDARVVSMPSWDVFKAQSKEYRDGVLPPAVKKRVAVEAASTFGWSEWVGDEGKVIGVDTFGHSAPYKDLYEFFGLTSENIVAVTKQLLSK